MARVAIHDYTEWRKRARNAGYCSERLARDLAISRRQLSRYTRTAFGRSPQDWLDHERLNEARELLKAIRCVKEVAFELGFKTTAHFSRRFKHFHGIPPTHLLASEDLQQSYLLEPFNPS
jgi:AraC-like DNA-binding protein